MTCQSVISDLSDVDSPSVATARMHILRFSSDGPGKLAGARRRTLCVHGTLKKWALYRVTFLSRSCPELAVYLHTWLGSQRL